MIMAAGGVGKGGGGACRCVGVREEAMTFGLTHWSQADWLTIKVGGGGSTSHINKNMKVTSRPLVSVIQSLTQRPPTCMSSSRDLPPLLFGRYQIILSETAAHTAEMRNSLSVFTDCTCLLPSQYPHMVNRLYWFESSEPQKPSALIVNDSSAPCCLQEVEHL